MKKEEMRRTTAVLPQVLHENTIAFAVKNKVGINQYITNALRWFVKEHGLDPDRQPKITISYD